VSYLTIQRKEGGRKNELNIISLQMVCGKHISLVNLGDIKSLLLSKVKEHPEKYKVFYEKIFSVIGPNNQDITFSGNGRTSPWILLIGYKGVQRAKTIKLLLIGQRIWGVELDQGMKLKNETIKLGCERLIVFLKNQVESMLTQSDEWDSVEIYLRE
jgi:hypothetical protein